MFQPIDELADAKNRKQARQAFYTPLSLVADMLRTSRLYEGAHVLEPSAGDGRIIHALRQAGCTVDACEIDPTMHDRCATLGATMIGRDFLQVAPSPVYDFIFMNPPFQNRQYRRHIEHAYKFLKPSPHSELVTIAPDTARRDFGLCELALPGCRYAAYEPLTGAFKESGSNVNTLLAWINGPDDDARLCEGFSNWPTYNVAVSLDSDQTWHYRIRRERPAPSALARDAGPYLADLSCNCYGVNWREVIEYITNTEEGDDDEPTTPADASPTAPKKLQAALF